MKPRRYLLVFILIYALLANGWLVGSLWLHDRFTLTLFSSDTQFHLSSLIVFSLLSVIYWLLATQYHQKQNNQQNTDAQISLERLQTALDASQEALWDWSLNSNEDVFFSAPYCKNLGYTQQEFGHNQQAWQSRLLPEEREQIYRKVMRFISEGDGHYDATYRMLHRDNSYRWIRSRGALIKNAQGQPIRFIGIARDITDQRTTAENLKQAIAVFESTHEGVLITDHNNTIVHINPAFSQITGYSADEVIGQTPRMFKSGRHSPEFYQAMWKALSSTGQWSGEIWNRRKSGEVLPQYQTIRLIRDENGFISHNVAVFSDISILKNSQSELNYLSLYDPLTGLANRSQLYERLKNALLRASEQQKNSAFFLIDLDHFKNINESLGHSLGDQLLQDVAKRLSKNIYNQSTLARMGGDEFVIICRNTSSPAEAASQAQHIIKSCKKPFLIDGNELFISVSIGICLFPEAGQCVEEIMRNAGSALSKAKASGRNTFAFYSSEMTEQAFQRIRIASELHHALEHDGLQVYYQPIYTMQPHRLVGCEALVRWHHPERGIIAPNEFIPIAEENGLISAIDHWILRQACTQMQKWLAADAALDFVAVNISSRSLSNNALPEQVAQALAETQLDPQHLELEVTESATMEDPVKADTILRQLHGLGIRLAIDDFGTGYSSLARLKSLPVDKLKIDQSFISNLPENVEDKAIVRAILALGASIGLEVQAEGIETAAQVQFLQQLNCAFGQGYLFGHPMTAACFSDLLNNHTVKA